MVHNGESFRSKTLIWLTIFIHASNEWKQVILIYSKWSCIDHVTLYQAVLKSGSAPKKVVTLGNTYNISWVWYVQCNQLQVTDDLVVNRLIAKCFTCLVNSVFKWTFEIFRPCIVHFFPWYFQFVIWLQLL